jgi:hypothetical protein
MGLCHGLTGFYEYSDRKLLPEDSAGALNLSATLSSAPEESNLPKRSLGHG